MDQMQAWDALYRTNKGKWRMETRGLPNIFKGKDVLELGVGNGKTLKSILKQKPASVTAIDFSEEAVRTAKEIFNDINIQAANVKRLPFQEEQFDIVLCHYILNNLTEEERKKAVSEILRVTKPGGNIIFEDFAVGDFRQKEGSKEIENNTIQKKDGIICHFFDVKEINELFSGSSAKKFTLKISRPITHKKDLKRKIISGMIEK